MLILFIALLVISIVLFGASFSMTDKLEDLEDQYEQLSVSTSQETYQLKRKIQMLEQQVVSSHSDPKDKNSIENDSQTNSATTDYENKPLLIQKVKHLHEQGFSLEDIERKTGILSSDIQKIVSN